jgi:hypothetical protein
MLWSHDGRTICRIDHRTIAVDVRTQPFDGAQGRPTVHVSRPRLLFEGDYVTGFDTGRHYHVMPDGRLLMLKAGVALERERSDRAGDFVVVLDWQDELERATGSSKGSR